MDGNSGNMGQIGGNNTSFTGHIMDNIDVKYRDRRRTENVISQLMESKNVQALDPAIFNEVYFRDRYIEISIHDQPCIKLMSFSINYKIHELHDALLVSAKRASHIKVDVYPKSFEMLEYNVKGVIDDQWMCFEDMVTNRHIVVHASYIDRHVFEDMLTSSNIPNQLGPTKIRNIKELLVGGRTDKSGTIENLICNSLRGYKLTVAVDKKLNVWKNISDIVNQDSVGKVFTVRVRNEDDANLVLRGLNRRLQKELKEQ
jgi:hypothetical protein